MLKELWTNNKVTFILGVILTVCLIAAIALLVVAIYTMVNGCPICGDHEWVRGNSYIMYVNGIAKIFHHSVCANCGYIL